MNEIERIDEAVRIGAGETRTFELDLEAEEFLHATVEQRGIDIALALIGPTGETLVRIDSPVGAHGTEELVAVAAAAGRYRLAAKYQLPRGTPCPEELIAAELGAPDRVGPDGPGPRRPDTP